MNDYLFGKSQRLINFIKTDKYDNMLPIKITKNRQEEIIPTLITMMKNNEDINNIKNFIQPYLIN